VSNHQNIGRLEIYRDFGSALVYFLYGRTGKKPKVFFYVPPSVTQMKKGDKGKTILDLIVILAIIDSRI
jgi:hypothetical protein